MKDETLEQLCIFIVDNGGRVPERHPMLKERHYRLLVLNAAKRIAIKTR